MQPTEGLLWITSKMQRWQNPFGKTIRAFQIINEATSELDDNFWESQGGGKWTRPWPIEILDEDLTDPDRSVWSLPI
jgi:hypothetical protein